MCALWYETEYFFGLILSTPDAYKPCALLNIEHSSIFVLHIDLNTFSYRNCSVQALLTFCDIMNERHFDAPDKHVRLQGMQESGRQ